MDALALLRLQVEWGADEALAEVPIDRLRPAVSALPPPAVTSTVTPALASTVARAIIGTPAASAPPSVAAAPARATPAERAAAAAGQAQTLDDLRAAIAAFDGCALRDTASNSVLPAGPADASLLLIGEPPGEPEDRSGTLFSGPDGLLLDAMLRSVGLDRATMLQVPLIPWRPPGGRPPSAAELTVCLPFLHRLIALTQPARIVLVGTLTARTLLGTTRRRAQPAWVDLIVPGLPTAIPALAMPGLRAVATAAAARREAWAALRLWRRSQAVELTTL